MTEKEKAEYVYRKLAREVRAAVPTWGGGWSFDVEQSGGFAWSHPGCKFAVYATPFWEGEPGVPCDMIDEDGKVVIGPRLPFDVTGDPHDDAARYYELVRPMLAGAMAWGRKG